MTHGPCRDEGSVAAIHLALQLRKLADQLELQDANCNTLCSTQEALSLCWEHRSLPKPCVELKELLEQSPIQAEAELKLLRPNDESTMVGFILCHGHAEAVVKYRGDFPWKATREECHFMLAHQMGLGHVVAPCIALELDLLRPDLAPPTTIREFLWKKGLMFLDVLNIVSPRWDLNTLPVIWKISQLNSRYFTCARMYRYRVAGLPQSMVSCPVGCGCLAGWASTHNTGTLCANLLMESPDLNRSRFGLKVSVWRWKKDWMIAMHIFGFCWFVLKFCLLDSGCWDSTLGCGNQHRKLIPATRGRPTYGWLSRDVFTSMLHRVVWAPWV